MPSPEGSMWRLPRAAMCSVSRCREGEADFEVNISKEKNYEFTCQSQNICRALRIPAFGIGDRLCRIAESRIGAGFRFTRWNPQIERRRQARQRKGHHHAGDCE